MITKQIAHNEFFTMLFPETMRALAHLEKIAKSSPWFFMGEEISYPGLWREDNGFIYLSDFQSHKITHYKLQEMLSKSSGLATGWLPFIVVLQLSRREKLLTVYGYGQDSPGSIREIDVTPKTEDIFLKIMEQQFQAFKEWINLSLLINERKVELPKLESASD